MENAVMRTRYPRHSIHARRKKRNFKETGTFMEKIARQTVMCIMILMVVGIINGVNTPVTNFLSQKIENILLQNIEPESVYSGIDGIIQKIANVKIFRKDSFSPENEGLNISPSSFDEDAVPASTSNYEDDAQGEEISENDMVEGDGVSTVEGENTAGVKGVTSTHGTAVSRNAASVQSTAASPQSSGFIVPVAGPVGSPYGERVDPLTQKTKLHKGIDIEANKGASIKAAQSGEVIESTYEKTYGYYIKIKHDKDLMTIYAHCSELIAKKGQKVKQGDIIAKVGNTGASVGAHLHFEVLKDGTAVNPLNYVKVSAR